MWNYSPIRTEPESSVSQHIVVDDLAEGVRRITLNRPESLNAFLDSMYGEAVEHLTEIGRDGAVRVVVLTGAGRGFCSGLDNVRPEPTNWVPPDVGSQHYTLHYVPVLYSLVAAIRNLPQPVIAAVNGPAAGLGFTLALACDLAIAARSAVFVNSFHNAGNGGEGGFSYLLPRAIGSQRAAELLLTSRPVPADEAERIGLVLRTVPDDELMDAVLEVAGAIAANAPLDVWLSKQNLQHGLAVGSIEQAVALETRAIAMANATEDGQEVRRARREKRPPRYRSR